jgi:hypothetical protein
VLQLLEHHSAPPQPQIQHLLPPPWASVEGRVSLVWNAMLNHLRIMEYLCRTCGSLLGKHYRVPNSGFLQVNLFHHLHFTIRRSQIVNRILWLSKMKAGLPPRTFGGVWRLQRVKSRVRSKMKAEGRAFGKNPFGSTTRFVGDACGYVRFQSFWPCDTTARLL